MKSNRQTIVDLASEVGTSIQSEIALANKEPNANNDNESLLATNEVVINTVTDIQAATTERTLEIAVRHQLVQRTASRKVDITHEKIAIQVENVSMATGVVAGFAAAGAALAAPTGLAAVGVVLGITSAPLIVTAAPVFAIIATVTGTISGGTYFYSKWKNHRKKANKS